MTSWTELKLKDISQIGDGAHASIKRVEVGVPYLTSKNFKDGGLDLSTLDFISEDDYLKHFREKSKAITKPKVDDLVLGIIGTLGSAYVIRASDKFGLSSSVAIIRPDVNLVIPKYLFYWVKSPKFQNSINQIKSGVAQSFLSLAMIGSLPISFPSVSIQTQITDILSAYDDLIENNLKRIKFLEEMAQITYEEWFVRLCFPNHEHTEIDAETGLPLGWKNAILGELIEFEIGGGWGNDELTDEFSRPAYVIRGTDIDKINLGDVEQVPFRFHKLSNLKSRKLAHGDIVFEVSGGSQTEGVAKSALISSKLLEQFPSDVMCASFCKLARPKSLDFSTFLFHLFRYLRKIGGTEVYEIRSASNIVNYNWTAFLTYQKIRLPDARLLKQFNEVCWKIHFELNNLSLQNQRLKEARDILLPRLMTGVIDVNTLMKESP